MFCKATWNIHQEISSAAGFILSTDFTGWAGDAPTPAFNLKANKQAALPFLLFLSGTRRCSHTNMLVHTCLTHMCSRPRSRALLQNVSGKEGRLKWWHRGQWSQILSLADDNGAHERESGEMCVWVYFLSECVWLCAHFLPALALHQEAVAKEPGVLFLLFQFSSV